MPMCLECKTVVGVGELDDNGLCQKCLSPDAKRARRSKAIEDDRLAKVEEEIKALSESELAYRLEKFFITTETVIDQPVEKRIEVIFSEYVYGLNVIKDFFIGIRDFVGGRVGSIEKPIRDTNQKIIKEMKMKAIALGGNAVVGLKIDYSVGGGLVSVIAVGTVVKLKKE